MDNQTSVSTLWQRFKDFLTNKIEYTRLTVAEKLTLLLAMIATCLIVLVGVSATMFFLSVALSNLLRESVGPIWSACIVAGIYVVVLIVIIAFRKQLIVNPIARFVTRLLM